MAVSYERQLIVFAEQIAYLEGLISGKYSNSMSLNGIRSKIILRREFYLTIFFLRLDILTHLKRIDELFKYIAVKIFKVHEDIKVV